MAVYVQNPAKYGIWPHRDVEFRTQSIADLLSGKQHNKSKDIILNILIRMSSFEPNVFSRIEQQRLVLAVEQQQQLVDVLRATHQTLSPQQQALLPEEQDEPPQSSPGMQFNDPQMTI